MGEAESNAVYILNILGGLLIFALTIPGAAVSIASFTISAKFWDTTCDNSSFMPLPTWLFINGLASIAYCFIGIFLFFSLRKKHQTAYLMYVFTSTVLVFLFKLPWNIVGATILFKYGSSCMTEARPLWDLTMGVLVIQWFILAIIVLNTILRCCAIYRESEKFTKV